MNQNNDFTDDLSDDFQMKPITAGLGFHKKPVSLKEHIVKSSLHEKNMMMGLPSEPPKEILEKPQGRSAKAIISELHEALKSPQSHNANVQLSNVLPREKTEIRAHPEMETPRTPQPSPIEKINFQIPEVGLNEAVGARRGASDNLVAPLTPVSVSFTSMFIDSVIILALSLIFLSVLISVTGVDVFSVVASAGSEFATQLSLAVLYIAIYEMYLIVARSFFGRTIGEWTFDLQMGTDEQIGKSYYPLLVLWRALFTLITGIVFLPLLSLLLSKDLARSFTGLQLYRRNY